MKSLKQLIAQNITRFRKETGLTQAELAEKINYSDKAVSKWERAESTPDILVLQELADVFGVKIDDFLHEENVQPVLMEKKESAVKKHNFKNIMYLSVIGVWSVAVIAFVAIWIASGSKTYFWQAFVAAVPVTFIVLLVQNSIWGNRRNNLYIISAFIWTALVAAYFLFFGYNLWLIFILGVPAQAAVIFSFRFKKVKTKKENEL